MAEMQTEGWDFLKQFQQNTGTNRKKNAEEDKTQRGWRRGTWQAASRGGRRRGTWQAVMGHVAAGITWQAVTGHVAGGGGARGSRCHMAGGDGARPPVHRLPQRLSSTQRETGFRGRGHDKTFTNAVGLGEPLRFGR